MSKAKNLARMKAKLHSQINLEFENEERKSSDKNF